MSLDPKVTAELDNAMKMRLRAKSLKDEAEALNKSANAMIGAILVSNDLTEYSVPGLGKASFRTSSGSRIDKTKLTENLLLIGIAPDEIEDLVNRSSSTWSKEYIEFRVKA